MESKKISKKPSKQRKKIKSLPLHKKRSLLKAHLSKELRDEFKKRAMTVRKGDVVEVMRGKYKGKKGKVAKVDYKNIKVYIEGLTRKKADGTEVLVGFHPSNVKIVEVYREDERRFR